MITLFKSLLTYNKLIILMFIFLSSITVIVTSIFNKPVELLLFLLIFLFWNTIFSLDNKEKRERFFSQIPLPLKSYARYRILTVLFCSLLVFIIFTLAEISALGFSYEKTLTHLYAALLSVLFIASFLILRDLSFFLNRYRWGQKLADGKSLIMIYIVFLNILGLAAFSLVDLYGVPHWIHWLRGHHPFHGFWGALILLLFSFFLFYGSILSYLKRPSYA